MFSKPEILAAVTPDFTSGRAGPAVAQPRLRRWSESDVPLLDEAAELLGDMDATGGRAQAIAEAQRKRDLANAEKAISNMNQQLEDSGVDGMLTAEQLADYNIVEGGLPDQRRAGPDGQDLGLWPCGG